MKKDVVCDAEEKLTSSGSPVHLELVVLQNNGRLPEVVKELRVSVRANL